MAATARYTIAAVTGALLLAAAAAGCAGGDDPSLADPTSRPEAPSATPATDGGQSDEATATDDDADDADGSDSGDAEPTTEPTPTTDGTPGEPQPTATPAPVSGGPAFTSASKLTTAGLDEIFFGDPVDAAAEKASTSWVGLPEPDARPQCFTVQPSGEPRGLVFTVYDGHIERVDVTTPVITTSSGAGVGSTASELDSLFGSRLEKTETAAGQEIAYVPTSAADQQFRIIWTVESSTVVAMRAGRIPQVLPATPCS